MTALAEKPAAFEIRGLPTADAREHLRRLRLCATADGWSLLEATGAVVFRGLGPQARHQCLVFARDHGVLAVYSDT